MENDVTFRWDCDKCGKSGVETNCWPKLEENVLCENCKNEQADTEPCNHDWIVVVDKDNYPEDIMCEKCKQVFILVVRERKIK